MSKQCVVGVFDSQESARLAIHVLDRAGYARRKISLVTRHLESGSDEEKELGTEDDSLRDIGFGAALGSLVGILGEGALVMFAGIGVLVGGPLLVAAGAVVGGLVGAMEGWGIHKSHIKQYEKLIQEGKSLVIVDGTPQEVAEAERLLSETKVEKVHLYAQSSDDAPEITDSGS